MSTAARLAALHGLTRSDFADDDAVLHADRARAAAEAARPRTGCADLTGRPGDLCSTCWTDHAPTSTRPGSAPSAA